jgi:DNA-binding transcriptional MerR regulator
MEKAPDAFRTISEVAEELDVPQHVLRFWETRFAQIKPMKRGGGRRYYRPDDIDLLRGIRHLLYGEGYTIRGVQRILKDEGIKFVQAVWRTGAPQPARTAEDAEDGGEDTAAAAPGAQEGSRGLLGLWPSILGATDEANAAGASNAGRIEPSLEDAGEAAPRETGSKRASRAARAVAPPDQPHGPAEPGVSGGELPREDIRRLQAALFELGECRRLLDAGLGENS